MDVFNTLSPDCVRCEARVSSKKHALELLSEMLADAANVDAGPVLDGLIARERLGSTGLGAAVAMPHARAADLAVPVAALLHLNEAVDYDSADGQPVDLLFGLLVPEDSSADELKEIREIVKRLRDPELQAELRATADPDALHDALTRALAAPARHPPQPRDGRRPG